MAAVAFIAMVLAAPADAAGTPRGCAEAVIQDWRDGHITGHYSPACYRAALAALPEDMRIYSSAEDDIRRALQTRLLALAAAHKAARVSPPPASASTTSARRASTPKARVLSSVKKTARNGDEEHLAASSVREAAMTGPGGSSIPLPLLLPIATLVLLALTWVGAAARRSD
ncbi:MAG TPA: hypothetical protein VEH52_06790 [Gaiellaceae bacterium]|nr:hypothetical protein [Gaiellaceae bacterium]